MKTLLMIMMVCPVLVSNGQTFKDEQVFTVNTSGLQSFRLYNHNGPVTIQGIDGNTATLKVRRNFKSISATRIEEAKGSITMDSIMVGGKIYFFMKHPDVKFEIDENGHGHYNSCCLQNNDRNYIKVKYEFEIELQVPKQLGLWASTHRKPLKIRDVNGELIAKNHHNDLTAENLGGNVQLRTHHGNIKASFTQNPTDSCLFTTHHGDIRVEYRQALNAEVFLKSHHGEFFTDFDWIPQALAVVENESDKGTKYVINDKTAVRIGAGGPRLDFRTWHGDIYLLNKDK